MKSENLLIPLNGLRAGNKVFSWHIGKEFFVGFDNSDILGADLYVEALVEKAGSGLRIDCKIDGSVTVACDRCLEDMEIPIEASAKIKVRFGVDEQCQFCYEDDREVIYIPADEAEMDLSQVVYDYSILSLPMQKSHKEGECNPEVLKYFAKKSEMSNVSSSKEESDEVCCDGPFAALKDFLKNV